MNQLASDARLHRHLHQTAATALFANLPGLLLCLALAGSAAYIGRQTWLASHGFSALTVAIVLGMVIGHAVPHHWMGGAHAGISFSKQWLLRAGIVLYGAKLTLQDIGRVGSTGVLIDTLVLCSTFLLAWLVGTRLFRLDAKTTLLIGAGSSICGAAAVLATEPIVRADADKVAVSIATVVVFGTLGIFLYPALHHFGWLDAVLPGGPRSFGVYEGSTIHEVAQVLAAAQSMGGQATDAAVIEKMVRVMMLAPFLIALSTWLAGQRDAGGESRAGAQGTRRIALPWFAFAFVGVVVVNSVIRWSPAIVAVANEVDLLLLGMAMAALGLTTHVSSIRRAGVRPLLLGALLWVWLIVGGAAINGFVLRLP